MTAGSFWVELGLESLGTKRLLYASSALLRMRNCVACRWQKLWKVEGGTNGSSRRSSRSRSRSSRRRSNSTEKRRIAASGGH